MQCCDHTQWKHYQDTEWKILSCRLFCLRKTLCSLLEIQYVTWFYMQEAWQGNESCLIFLCTILMVLYTINEWKTNGKQLRLICTTFLKWKRFILDAKRSQSSYYFAFWKYDVKHVCNTVIGYYEKQTACWKNWHHTRASWAPETQRSSESP